MDQLSVLKKITFGARVAEDETAELAKYFVETDQWARIVSGEVDVVRGDKGAGKSAIYSLLISKTDDFFDHRILLIAGEKPRGAPVFKDIIAAPPVEEIEFVGLWKLYILALIAQKMREFDIRGPEAARVYSALEASRLLEREYDLAGILRAAQDLARKLFRAESVEGGLKLEPATGLPAGLTGKITFREPDSALRDRGFLSVDSLISLASTALRGAGYKIWVLLDRLDVAFAETHELERNALRALFRAYRDIAEHDEIKLKIFLRSDIWSRITEEGFREASHITKFVVLDWSSASLLNLVIRRILSNRIIVEQLALDPEQILSNFAAQSSLFYRLFPKQVDQGSNKPSSFDWMVSRCADGTGKTAPRELIHLLTSLRETEISRLERGESPAPAELLFDRSVFKEALPTVSETRLVQNLLAEYPDVKPFVQKLRTEKTEQTTASLAKLWDCSESVATEAASKLIRIGFFQPRGARDRPTYWVPFLYRDALQMSQGTAE